MAFKEKEFTKAGREQTVSGLRRQGRAQRDRQEGEVWTRADFLRDLGKATAPISNEIAGNPRDAARLRKSREQVQEGEIHWGVEDDERKPKTDAGG
ncbi:MAG: hypothetical protein WB507_09980 [Solirubrobacterales bacterium]